MFDNIRADLFTAYIYALRDPRTNRVRYVGKTLNPKVRLALHMSEHRASRKNTWLRDLKSVGLTPIMEILETIPNCTDADWPAREVYWIARYRAMSPDLTNLDGGGQSGFLKSEHTRSLIRAKAIGRVMSRSAVEKMRQKKMNPSDETRNKLRMARLGKRHSAETIQRMRASSAGHSVSTETRRKIGAANALKTRTDAEKEHLRQINIGKKASPETRAKQSATLKQKGHRPSPQCIAASIIASKNRVVSEETRQRLRTLRLGKRLSEEEKARQRAMRSPVTAETRAKIGAAHRGRKQSPEQIAKRVAAFKLTWRTNRQQPLYSHA